MPDPCSAADESAGRTDRKFLKIKEFVAVTGLSLATVHRRLKSNQIPKYQSGGKGCRVLIPVEAVSAVASQTLPGIADSAPPTVAEQPQCTRAAKPPRLSGPPPKWRRKRH